MADKNRDQWRDPYNQDWDNNENRYNQDWSKVQRNRGLGNVNKSGNYDQGRRDFNSQYNQGSGGEYRRDDYNNSYGTSGEYGSGMNRNDWDRRRYQTGQNRDQEYGGKYGNSYGTHGAFGNNEGDWNRRDYERGDYNRDTRRNNIQGTSYGQRGYYGNNEEQGNYGRRNYSRNDIREDRSWWDKTTDEVSSWFGDDEAERRRESDKQYAGQHKGKGPKGYSRSDDRIKEDISDRLSDDDYVDASDIDVQVNGSEVILTGTVDSREAKRRAEDIAERISGVRNVENRLRVGTERLSVGGSTINITNDSNNRTKDI